MAAPPPSRRIPIVLATRALVSFGSASRAAGLALPDFALAAFFIAGVTAPVLGASAASFVLAAVVIGIICRAIDVESWALFIPGGVAGRVERAFGPRASLAASAAVLLERLLAGALACEVFGHYAGTTGFALFGIRRFLRQATIGDVSTTAALFLLGYLWIRARTGHLLGVRRRVRDIWISAGVVLALIVWAWITGIFRLGWPGFVPPAAPAPPLGTSWRHPFDLWLIAVGVLASLGYALPAIGSGDTLARVASELEPPRIRGLRRTALIIGAVAVVITAGAAFLFVGLVPAAERMSWVSAPLLGIAGQIAGPRWVRTLLTLMTTAAAALMLAQAARAALTGAESVVTRLAARGVLSDALRAKFARSPEGGPAAS